jgi:hypothetical protein
VAITIWLLSALVATLDKPSATAGEEEPTPLAGEEFHTKVFGEPVTVPARDRKHLTAVSIGVQYLPDGPSDNQVLPFGAFYVWRNTDDMRKQFRGTFAGFVNDVSLNLGSQSHS